MPRPERDRSAEGDEHRRGGSGGPNPSRRLPFLDVLATAWIGRLDLALRAKQIRQAADIGCEVPGKGVDPLRAGDEQLKGGRAGSILASRMTKIGFCLLTARSTSRATKAEPFEPFDSTSTKALALSMPLMISSP
jgi:hypothetical protein